MSQTRCPALSQPASRPPQQVLGCFAELTGGADDAALISRAAFLALAKFAANALHKDSDLVAQARMAVLGLDMALSVLASKETAAARKRRRWEAIFHRLRLGAR